MIITNLLTNMVAVSLSGFLSKEVSQRPAFQEYAYQAMFQQASNMIVSWNLDLPRPVTTNMVTSFSASAYVEGMDGGMSFSNRFAFGWFRGRLDIFHDKPYIPERTHSPDVEANDTLLEQWMRTTNLLTLAKAQNIAESTLQSLGVPIGKQEFKKPEKAIQLKYEWKDGKLYPLPYYAFSWKTNELGAEYETYVSGIVSNVVELFCANSSYTKALRPTNYFELLGLPARPVFVCSREQPFSFTLTKPESVSNAAAGKRPQTYEIYQSPFPLLK